MIRAALISTLFFTGCASKQVQSYPPGVRVVHYRNCKEVSIDAKTQQVTLICPISSPAKAAN
jgi:hypothetical protein